MADPGQDPNRNPKDESVKKENERKPVDNMASFGRLKTFGAPKTDYSFSKAPTGPTFRPNLARAKSAPVKQEPTTSDFQAPRQYREREKPLRTFKSKFETTEDISTPTMAPTFESNDFIPQKKTKKYKHKDIAPTAIQMGIDALDPTHPATIPFMDPSKSHSLKSDPFDAFGIPMDLEDNTESKPAAKSIEGDMYQQEARATNALKEVVQTNIAGNLFKNDEGSYLGNNDVMFIQLPPELPRMDHKPAQAPATQVADKRLPQRLDSFQNTLASVPEGKIGKMYILASGQVKMKIGDVYFDVSQGMPVAFLQDLMAFHIPLRTYHSLGEVNKRMVVSPDIANLLD